MDARSIASLQGWEAPAVGDRVSASMPGRSGTDVARGPCLQIHQLERTLTLGVYSTRVGTTAGDADRGKEADE
jgi:hypothetical protein